MRVHDIRLARLDARREYREKVAMQSAGTIHSRRADKIRFLQVIQDTAMRGLSAIF
jgi:hypothetical protein